MEKKRNQQEIDRQIAGLERMNKNVPPTSLFGSNNFGAINAQISVLKGEHTADHYYHDEFTEEYQDGDNDIWMQAETAEQWLRGLHSEDLFEE